VDDELSSKTIAERAGLLYLPADRPGVVRRRAGKGFAFIGKDGRRASERDVERARALVIPPAWTDVWVAPEARAHLQATGIDQAGRRQYLYHPAWRAAADAAKFDRLATFAPALAQLRRRVDLDLRSRAIGWQRAAVVRLIDESLIRPGNLRHFQSNGSVGATTLSDEHVEVRGRVVHLEFEGKASVPHEVTIRDALLARRVSDLLDLAQPGSSIFVTDDGASVGCEDVNEYVRMHAGGTFTAKDLRTWGGTCAVAEHLLTTRSTDVAGAFEFAAERLGNTVAVCRSAYVAPLVIESFEDGSLLEAWRASRSARWLSRAEQTVRRVLVSSGPITSPR
jgi:DNA topoisomerase-1